MKVQFSYLQLSRKYDAAKEELTLDELKSLLIKEEDHKKEAKERAAECEINNIKHKKT